MLRISAGIAKPCRNVVHFAIFLAWGIGFPAKNEIRAKGADIISLDIMNSNWSPCSQSNFSNIP